MANIGGNILGAILTKTTEKNQIGESVETWAESASCYGWLGMQTGGSGYKNFNAKIEESDHVFLCDYSPDIYALADEDVRMMIKGSVYDALLIDNPDEMDEQLEIYLRKVGGQ